jgi:hypothetical protein
MPIRNVSRPRLAQSDGEVSLACSMWVVGRGRNCCRLCNGWALGA